MYDAKESGEQLCSDENAKEYTPDAWYGTYRLYTKYRRVYQFVTLL